VQLANFKGGIHMLNFDNLSETKFEELCFDIFKSLGFINLTWRKGTGLPTSPADQGRDLEAEYIVKSFDGKQRIEKYYIECKHHKKGLSPDKIQNAISWANSGRPDELIIVTSYWLSNPTKQYIDEYKRNNKPTFRINTLENTDIEGLIINKLDIQHKYKLDCDISFMKYINKYHILYSLKPQLNTANYLIKILDDIDAKKRDKAFINLYMTVINPYFKEPITGNETLQELFVDKVDYDSFRKILLSNKYDYNTIYGLVCSMLSWVFHFGDISSIDNSILRMKSLIKFIQNGSNTDNLNIEDREFIQDINNKINELPDTTNEYYDLYNYVCENVIRKLLIEKPNIIS
jgi:hypothetical protein